jgi:hypothetical protein
LVFNHTVPGSNNPTFDVYAIYGPDFAEPWLLATPVKLKAESVRAIYRDRWPTGSAGWLDLEFPGCHSPRRSHRFLGPAVQAHPRMLPADLEGKPFLKDYALFPGQLRKKNSVTSHLPKGNPAPRQEKTASMPFAAAGSFRAPVLIFFRFFDRFRRGFKLSNKLPGSF